MKKLFLLLILSPIFCFAKSQKTNTSVYKSDVDDLLTIKKIAVLPATDNLRGIYSRPIEDEIKKRINENHHWDLSSSESAGQIVTAFDLENDPSLAKKVSNHLNADAFIVAQATKGPKGLNITLKMYLTKNGQMLAQSELKNSKKFEIKEIRQATSSLLTRTLRKIPYNAIVLSRSGNRVTLNVGTNDGIKNGQVLTVVQIIKANFHPKFNFIISTEKEIIGKIKILKVDKTLSFGQIITEVEKQAIQKNAKVTGLDSVTYAMGGLGLSNTTDDNLSSRQDSKVSFGSGAIAWLPKKPPTFGAITAALGIGPYKSDIKKAPASASESDSFGKKIILDGELWLTPRTSIHARIDQGIVGNNSIAAYEVLFGYNFRLNGSVWGPQVELLAGYSTYQVDVADVGGSILNLKYSGFKWGVTGSFPLSTLPGWGAGAKLFMVLNPSLSQIPTAPASNVTANHFNVFAYKKMGVNVKLVGNFDVELHSAKFSGASASSSQKHTTLSGGVTWMF